MERRVVFAAAWLLWAFALQKVKKYGPHLTSPALLQGRAVAEPSRLYPPSPWASQWLPFPNGCTRGAPSGAQIREGHPHITRLQSQAHSE